MEKNIHSPENNKTYTAKVNMPGCKAGTIVNYKKYVETGPGKHRHRNIIIEENKQPYKYEDGTVCTYDCANEPDFFEVVLPAKFKPGKNVILHTSLKARLCDDKGVLYTNTFTLPAYTEFNVIREKRDGRNRLFVVVCFSGKYYLLPENVVNIPNYYWYVSSKGEVHRGYVGRDPKADKFRIDIGNFSEDATKAHEYKDGLTKLKLARK